MAHDATVSPELLETAKKLSLEHGLEAFRMVGGTAIALQLGHRKSVDIDFFSNDRLEKKTVVEILSKMFPNVVLDVTDESISTTVKGVRLELYDNWPMPFLTKPIREDGMRVASLRDLAAFKLEAITERREKKDYIDLYVLFESLGATAALTDFKLYNPHISPKSILFALEEVNTASKNKSVMPEMLTNISWSEIEKSMISAAREYLKLVDKTTTRKKSPRRQDS